MRRLETSRLSIQAPVWLDGCWTDGWMGGWRILSLAVRRVKKVAPAAKNDESGLALTMLGEK